MKKLITSAFFTFTILSAIASDGVNKLHTEASDIARRMANQIELNESEYIQVKQYTFEKLTNVATVREMYANDPEMMMRKLKEIDNLYSSQVENLLNTKQFDNYLAISKSLNSNQLMIAEISNK